MKFITCPETPDFSGELPKIIFMAGGITGCPDWQSEFQTIIKSHTEISDDFVMVNPRRPNFDVRDPSMSEQQIEWEAKWLERAWLTTFYFPPDSLCPITLFELGKQLGLGRNVLVAAHSDYARKIDLVHQLRLMRPDARLISGELPLVQLAWALEEACEQSDPWRWQKN